ncbi:hypothetical protein C5F61_10235 [Photobacterium damselae subsp. damselae]|nr:hypothetical protein BST98_07250 [Photobacterium damselae]PSB77722.1 hypothetical protein C5F61_10235 [Photobacterium damselae subsp. damselae]
MGSYIAIAFFVIGGVLLYYFWPLIKFRLETKKVRLTYVNKDGHKKSKVLYLCKNDPLWDVVNSHKISKEA